MTKYFVLGLTMASLLASPSFANKERRAKAQKMQSVEKNEQALERRGKAVERRQQNITQRKDNLENLNENQKAALQSYREKMQAHQADKGTFKADRSEHRKTQKEAFIKGDFDKVSEVEKTVKTDRSAKMAAHDEARMQAMKESFSTLTPEERESLFDVVIKDYHPKKMARP